MIVIFSFFILALVQSRYVAVGLLHKTFVETTEGNDEILWPVGF